MNALFLFRMERVLDVYARAYHPKNPVLCYDERPCFLIGEAVPGLAMKAEQVKREHYAYEKLGSCSLLETIEPLTGKRIAEVFTQRRKIEFARHFQKVAAAFPAAERLTVILDNLNTHNESSFYEAFSAEEAKRLSDKFEFVYTPPKASWLNMIEIEFSAVSRLCLDRRIASQKELEKQVLAFATERSEKAVKINWQFSLEAARTKLNRHYKKVNPENQIYLET
jgi:transposase